MKISGSRNRDMPCFTSKALEEKWFGSRNKDATTLEKTLKIASAFVGDTDLWANGQ